MAAVLPVDIHLLSESGPSYHYEMICSAGPRAAPSLVRMLLAVLVASGTTPLAPRWTSAADASVGPCAAERLTITNATQTEAQAVCAALVEVVDYFVAFEFSIAPAVMVILRSQPVHEEAIPRMHGHFDAARSTVVVTRSLAGAWGLASSPAVTASFLRHEFVHLVVHRILGGEQARLRREWHEFIAYAVQLALMEPAAREGVLAVYPDALAVEHLTEINEFTYGTNPERFAVVAYRTYLARGGAGFVEQLLRFQIVPPPISYPFPVLPSEIGR